MAPKTPVIETGVDKLIALLEKKKDLSIPEAADMLGVPRVVVEEWAAFLEEEGLISIDYKFATARLKLKKLTERETKRKTQEFIGKKEGFLRQLESTLSYINKEQDWLDKLKKEFEGLTAEVGEEVKSIEGELKTLEKFEKLKTGLDKDIVLQEESFKKKVQHIGQELEEKKKTYGEFLRHIKEEEVSLDKEKDTAVALLEEEDKLSKELKKINAWIDSLNRKIGDEEGKIHGAEKHIDELKKYADTIRGDIQGSEQEIAELISKSKEQETNIVKLQEGILSKFLNERKKMAAGTKSIKDIQESFTTAFATKKEILNLFTKMERELVSIREDFHTLIKEARIIKFTTGESDVEKHAKEMEEKYKELERRREEFERGALKLTSLLKEV